jgi:hypothetical protein
MGSEPVPKHTGQYYVTRRGDACRFLVDVSARPLSTTVSRYQRLHLSRPRGNAARQSLQPAGLIAPAPIATRCGQVVLYHLTDAGRSVCSSLGIDPGARPPGRADAWSTATGSARPRSTSRRGATR